MMKLDKWLLERVFEPAACEIESWTGINQYQVARFFALVSITADAAEVLNKQTPKDYVFFGLALIGVGCLVGMTFVAQHLSRRVGVANWMKHDRFVGIIRMGEFAIGALSVLLIVVHGWPSLSNISSLCYALAYGFMSGDRLPPKERRVFQPAEAPSSV